MPKPYKASKLAVQACYLSNIVSRGTQTVTGEQLDDALEALNCVISEQSIGSKTIPYFKNITISAITGQEKYFIPNLIEIENATFLMTNVRYPMFLMNRNSFFGTPRATNINSMPYTYCAERTVGGTNLYFYFTPNNAYPITIWGKFGFDIVEADTDLSEVWDYFYINYIKLLAAEYICCINGNSLPEQTYRKLRSIEQKMTDMNPVDYTMKKYSSFTANNYIGYSYANLGTGFYPT